VNHTIRDLHTSIYFSISFGWPSQSTMAPSSTSARAAGPDPMRALPAIGAGGASGDSGSGLLRFEDGAVQFRQRLIVSVLSCRPVLIKNIRSEQVHTTPGLKRHEVSFLRLLSSVTNGTKIDRIGTLTPMTTTTLTERAVTVRWGGSSRAFCRWRRSGRSRST
jgi:RNA 3'-terminal phosphate cyclase